MKTPNSKHRISKKLTAPPADKFPVSKHHHPRIIRQPFPINLASGGADA
jgi:hypothetical protein